MNLASTRRATSLPQMQQLRSTAIKFTPIFIAALTALGLTASTADAAPLKVLHTFCGANCGDGQSPMSSLATDSSSGNLFGTTELGGANGTSTSGGVVFELVPNAAKTRWQEKVLYSFCAAANCTDGSKPEAGLLFGNDGHLYGTTVSGGANNLGTVFELIPNAGKTRWREKVLYSFCSAASCADGDLPLAGLIMDQSGNLYGTAEQGGGPNIAGVVFELIPNASKTRWRERVIYSFCPTPDTNPCPDGAYPQAALLMDTSGNLYGTTGGGGPNGGGTVFELAPNAAKTRWREKVLYSFCSAADCVDGQKPTAALVLGPSGNLFGTTQETASSTGTVFELLPNAAKTRWREKVLYTFCTLASCADGQQPVAGVVMDGAGLLYGTTESGGSGGVGTVFELIPNAAKTRWREKVLHSFCNSSTCGGREPEAGLLLDKTTGNLYGTASSGPLFSVGTAFEVVLHRAQ